MRREILMIVAASALGAVANAKPMMPNRVPIARLRANVERVATANPKDSAAWLALGRLDAMTFAYPETTEVGIYGSTNGTPNFPGYMPITVKAPTRGDATVRARAIDEFRKALAADPTCALCALGLGSILEAGDPPDADGALEAYRTAWALTREHDLKATELGPWYDLGGEAGTHLVERLEAKKNRTKKEDIELASVKSDLATIEKKPHVVSPIVFGFAGARSLGDLLAPGTSAGFDLDTLGGSQWPWVKPTTAFLVWDPGASGKVASGAQLFGTMSFGAYFRDGYAALAALDDDGDGWLSGHELDGIGVWRDANGNGIADRGEVQTAGYWEITRIAAHATGRRDGVPFASEGIRLRDGWTVPTWDWTPRALAPSDAGL